MRSIYEVNKFVSGNSRHAELVSASYEIPKQVQHDDYLLPPLSGRVGADIDCYYSSSYPSLIMEGKI